MREHTGVSCNVLKQHKEETDTGVKNSPQVDL